MPDRQHATGFGFDGRQHGGQRYKIERRGKLGGAGMGQHLCEARAQRAQRSVDDWSVRDGVVVVYDVARRRGVEIVVVRRVVEAVEAHVFVSVGGAEHVQ